MTKRDFRSTAARVHIETAHQLQGNQRNPVRRRHDELRDVSNPIGNQRLEPVHFERRGVFQRYPAEIEPRYTLQTILSSDVEVDAVLVQFIGKAAE